MLSVRFDGAGPGQCSWCNGTKEEVFTVAFSDNSFDGTYCVKDLMKAVRTRMKAKKPAEPANRINTTVNSVK